MEAMRRKSEALQAMAYLGQASAFLDQAHLGQLLFSTRAKVNGSGKGGRGLQVSREWASKGRKGFKSERREGGQR